MRCRGIKVPTETSGSQCTKLIVTDGVFSMDGDIAPLDKLYELSREYKALLMVDDAHATGTIGNGHGTAAYIGLEKEIDIQLWHFEQNPLGPWGAMLLLIVRLLTILLIRAVVLYSLLPYLQQISGLLSVHYTSLILIHLFWNGCKTT